jgi:hypothetical protein
MRLGGGAGDAMGVATRISPGSVTLKVKRHQPALAVELRDIYASFGLGLCGYAPDVALSCGFLISVTTKHLYDINVSRFYLAAPIFHEAFMVDLKHHISGPSCISPEAAVVHYFWSEAHTGYGVSFACDRSSSSRSWFQDLPVQVPNACMAAWFL